MEPKKYDNPELEILVDETTDSKIAARVILYNDDWHSFDEVIFQLIKAVRCSFDQARDFAFEVHVKGKAVVFSGDMLSCIKVSSILEEIALFTQIVA